MPALLGLAEKRGRNCVPAFCLLDLTRTQESHDKNIFKASEWALQLLIVHLNIFVSSIKYFLIFQLVFQPEYRSELFLHIFLPIG
jgi:hypothetical protein